MGLIADRLLKPVAGLAFEATAARKNSKSPSPLPAPQQEDVQYGLSTSGVTPTSPPPSYADVIAELSSAPEHSNFESDEQEWQLDEAAEAVAEESPAPSTVPKGNIAGPSTVVNLAAAFVAAHPPKDRTYGARLNRPVIIPQRRPHDRHRGFVRAYAPLLGECGIMDQTAWIEFLDSFDEAIKVTPVFNAINYAAQIVGLVGTFVPSATAAAVSTAITIAEEIGKEAYGRVRVNSYLDEMNSRYFKPQGLYCLIMSYKPNASVATTFDLTSTIIKATTPSDSAWKQKLKALNKSAATTHGEVEMPEAAPLIYPTLDQASDAQKEGFFARKKNFVVDYYDRRAQATFVQENPSSSLATNPQFASRYGNPSAFDNLSLGSLVGAGLGSVRTQRTGSPSLPSSSSSEMYGSQGYEALPLSSGRTSGREDFGAYSGRVGQRMEARRERRAGGGLIGGLVGAVAESVSRRGQGSEGGERERAEERQWERDAQRQSGRADHTLVRGRSDMKPPVRGYIKKLLRPNVIYLMVVRLPPEEELEAARRLLLEARQ